MEEKITKLLKEKWEEIRDQVQEKMNLSELERLLYLDYMRCNHVEGNVVYIYSRRELTEASRHVLNKMGYEQGIADAIFEMCGVKLKVVFL